MERPMSHTTGLACSSVAQPTQQGLQIGSGPLPVRYAIARCAIQFLALGAFPFLGCYIKEAKVNRSSARSRSHWFARGDR